MVTTHRNPKDPETPPAHEETITAAQPREQDVAQRAYELYEKRGGREGQDWDDWFQAEQELRQSTVGAPQRHEEDRR